MFYGLENLNVGFDAESIYYFSEFDFGIVIDRVEKYGIAIFGIESWLNRDFYDVISFEKYRTVANDPKWYRKAFSFFKVKESILCILQVIMFPKSGLSNEC